MKIKLFALMFATFLIFGITALAHHSFAGSYIEDKTVTIEGKVVQFDIRNPHSFINIEVIKDGKASRWGGEWGGVTQLSEGGVNKFTLKVGDRVIIDGAPSRDSEEHKVLIRTVTRPAVGNTPEFKWGGTVR